MSLISPKVFAKFPVPQTLPDDHLQAVAEWKERIASGDLLKQNEKSLHASFAAQIMVKLLGYRLFGEGKDYTLAREYRIARGDVDLALGYFTNDNNKADDQVFAVFEAKGAKTKDLDAIMPGRHKTPVQQAWEYARDAKGCQWVLVTNYTEIRLYHIGETSLVYETFDLANLTDPAEYARFQLCLHADNLLTGKTLELLRQTHQVGKDITDRLYDDYKSLRETLIVNLVQDNPAFKPIELMAPAQKLLDRILFLAFAEDSGLIPEHSIAQAYQHADPYNPRPVYENFKGLFRAVDKGNPHLNIPAYNGGLFADDLTLDNLVVSDSLCEAFKELADYDFASEVSVTVLGHIFEQSIADLEELAEQLEQGQPIKRQEKARAVSGKRKLQGVVYTPDSITAFIVEQTLGQYLQLRFDQLLADFGQLKSDGSIQWKRGKQTELKFWYAWQESLQTIRVVDPACGSGAFLVAAFDYLHGEYQRINDKLSELTGQPGVFDLNKEILNNNLYGVDINPESIEITKLSLWLKTAERGKPLTTLDTCIRQGNSLGLTEAVDIDGFCWQTAFPAIFAEGGFDVVLGNPPYVRQERFSDLKPWLAEHYAVYNGVVDLYAYFFELGLKLLKPSGLLGYISSATFFKTGSGKPLRQYLARQSRVHKVVDFGDLQVFEGVTTYPAILVLENSKPEEATELQMLLLGADLPDNLSQLFAQAHGRMRQVGLSDDSWQLEDEALAALRFKLTHDSEGKPYPCIKDVYGTPYRGVLTGLNEAFVIDQATRDRLVAEDPACAEVLKPFLEGKDLRRWYSADRNLWLIFTRRGTDINSYPSIKAYLENFRGRLEPKPKSWSDKTPWQGRKTGSYKWFEIQDTVAYHHEFAKPKVIWADISQSNSFSMSVDGGFLTNTGYMLPDADFFSVGWFNSTAFQFLFKAGSTAIRGGFYRYIKQNIESMPVPSVTAKQREEIATLAELCQQLAEQRYQISQRFIQRMIDDLCPQGRAAKINTKVQSWWQLDFKSLQVELRKSFKLKRDEVLISLAERDEWQDYFDGRKKQVLELDDKLAAQEMLLNQAVNRLFGLTEDEVRLLDQ